MDLIDRHVAAENAHDVAATLATYTEDVVRDDALSHAKTVRETADRKDQQGAGRKASDS